MIEPLKSLKDKINEEEVVEVEKPKKAKAEVVKIKSKKK